MSANFIFEAPERLRVTQFIPITHYDIGELNFYISSARFGLHCQAFVIMKNDKELYEIVELAKVGTSGQDILYKVPINQQIRINEEFVNLKLLVIDNMANTYYISTETKIYITTENYSIARQIYIAKDIGQRIQNYYSEIIGLKNQIQQIYEEIKKGDHK